MLRCYHICTIYQPLCCCWLIWPIQNNAKNLKNDLNLVKWVLIWEVSARAFQWIPTRQCLDSFQNCLRSCALDKSSLSIERANSCLTPLPGFSSQQGQLWGSCQWLGLIIPVSSTTYNWLVMTSPQNGRKSEENGNLKFYLLARSHLCTGSA